VGEEEREALEVRLAALEDAVAAHQLAFDEEAVRHAAKPQETWTVW
jgi:hypothetical protein